MQWLGSPSQAIASALLNLPILIRQVTTVTRICYTDPAGQSNRARSRQKRPTREQTIHLKRWLTANLHNPHLSKRQRLALVIESGLDHEQVKTWFGNARRRLKKEKAKATCGNNTNSLSNVQQDAAVDSQQFQQPHQHQPLNDANWMNFN